MHRRIRRNHILFVIDDFKADMARKYGALTVLTARSYPFFDFSCPPNKYLIRNLLQWNADMWSLKERRSFHGNKYFPYLLDLLNDCSSELFVLEERSSNLEDCVQSCWQNIDSPLKELTSSSVEGMAFAVFISSLIEGAKLQKFSDIHFLCDNFPFLESKKGELGRILEAGQRIEGTKGQMNISLTFKKQIRGDRIHFRALLGLADAETSTIGRILTRKVKEMGNEELSVLRIGLSDEKYPKKLTPVEIENRGIACPNIPPHLLLTSMAELQTRYQHASHYWSFIEKEIIAGRCLWNYWRQISRLIAARRQDRSMVKYRKASGIG